MQGKQFQEPAILIKYEWKCDQVVEKQWINFCWDEDLVFVELKVVAIIENFKLLRWKEDVFNKKVRFQGIATFVMYR